MPLQKRAYSPSAEPRPARHHDREQYAVEHEPGARAAKTHGSEPVRRRTRKPPRTAIRRPARMGQRRRPAPCEAK